MGILNRCLIPSRTEERAFLHDFYYLVEDRIDLLLPLAVGTQIKVLCLWAARADAQYGPQNKILPQATKRRQCEGSNYQDVTLTPN